MDKRMFAVDGVNFAGVLMIVLGLVNCVAAPLFTMQDVFNALYPESKNAVLFMVLGTSISTAFSGSLLMYASRHMRTRQWWAWRLAWRVTWFLLLLAAGGMVAMWQNPFPEILVVLDLILLFALVSSQKLLRTDPNMEWPK
jgi:uncharacterized membrane protein (UPF0136 family)